MRIVCVFVRSERNDVIKIASLQRGWHSRYRLSPTPKRPRQWHRLSEAYTKHSSEQV